jgi:hypothetical protein
MIDRSEDAFDQARATYEKSPRKMKTLPAIIPITPPVDHGTWVEPLSEAGTGALVFNLCADQIARRLEEMEIEPLTILGVQKNEFALEDFTDSKWINRPLACQITQLELPPEHPDYLQYHGKAVVSIDGKALGTLAPESPKLSVGTTFEATLSPKSGVAVFLDVNNASIQLSPDSSPTREQASLASPPAVSQADQRLFEAINRTYREQCPGGGKATITVGDWKAFVKESGEVMVRTPDRETVFRGNLQEGTIDQPLGDRNTQALAAMRERRRQSSQSIQSQQHPVSTKPPATAKSGIDLD